MKRESSKSKSKDKQKDAAEHKTAGQGETLVLPLPSHVISTAMTVADRGGVGCAFLACWPAALLLLAFSLFVAESGWTAPPLQGNRQERSLLGVVSASFFLFVARWCFSRNTCRFAVAPSPEWSVRHWDLPALANQHAAHNSIPTLRRDRSHVSPRISSHRVLPLVLLCRGNRGRCTVSAVMRQGEDVQSKGITG